MEYLGFQSNILNIWTESQNIIFFFYSRPSIDIYWNDIGSIGQDTLLRWEDHLALRGAISRPRRSRLNNVSWHFRSYEARLWLDGRGSWQHKLAGFDQHDREPLSPVWPLDWVFQWQNIDSRRKNGLSVTCHECSTVLFFSNPEVFFTEFELTLILRGWHYTARLVGDINRQCRLFCMV